MTSTKESENVGIALALVLAAAASTAVGAAVVFFPSIVKLASRRVLAGSLGFAGGVMSYVSFIEIFQKSRTSFEGQHEDKTAYLYATLSFFFGVLFMLLLNSLVSVLLGGHSHHAHQDGAKDNQIHNKKSRKKKNSNKKTTTTTSRETIDDELANANATQPPCCSKDPVGQLERLQKMADVLNEEGSHSDAHQDGSTGGGGNNMQNDDGKVEIGNDNDFVDNFPLGDHEHGDSNISEGAGSEEDEEEDDAAEEENKRLVRMGIQTALAIGLHNFPEGLATFVAAIDDPRVGSILAFAIAIHNIPEGLCVALPIYYATGNRLNAFLWALLSGASELVAALLGWALLANVFSDDLYGVLFGMVAGMMVVVSIRELVPTAHFYDPEDTVVTYSFIGGMLLIAFSLVLFTI